MLLIGNLGIHSILRERDSYITELLYSVVDDSNVLFFGTRSGCGGIYGVNYHFRCTGGGHQLPYLFMYSDALFFAKGVSKTSWVLYSECKRFLTSLDIPCLLQQKLGTRAINPHTSFSLFYFSQIKEYELLWEITLGWCSFREALLLYNIRVYKFMVTVSTKLYTAASYKHKIDIPRWLWHEAH